MKINLKILKRNPKKCTEAGVNENKWTEYTKKLIKKIPIRKMLRGRG